MCGGRWEGPRFLGPLLRIPADGGCASPLRTPKDQYARLRRGSFAEDLCHLLSGPLEQDDRLGLKIGGHRGTLHETATALEHRPKDP